MAAVISNRADAGGLQFAAQHQVATAVVDHKAFSSREAFDTALAEEIDRHSPALVVLAGFMRILTPAFVERYAGRLINIHPSLLPAFPGLHAQRQALEFGATVAGCTVHFVDEAVDHGVIILQRAVDVLPHDTERTLADRILQQEHLAYPEAISRVLSGAYRVHGRRYLPH